MEIGFSPKNVCWLIPDEPTPCDLFFYFKGQYALVLSTGQPISIDVLNKIAKAGFQHAYVKTVDAPQWDLWTKHRVIPNEKPAEVTTVTNKVDLYGNKRLELISYMLKSMQPKDQNAVDISQAIRSAKETIEGVIKSPMLDWYFKKFHEPPDLFQHSARVTFLVTIFCRFFKLLDDRSLENLVFSMVIHEMEGDPSKSHKTIVSEQTINYLKSKSYPVPEEVIQLVKMHDELHSGKGFPQNKKGAELPMGIKIFNLANHFDHYRIGAVAGTRRARIDAAKKNLEARQDDYDPKLWKLFWFLLEKYIEVVA